MLKLPKPSRNALMTALGISLIAGTVIAQAVPTEPIIWDKRRLDQLDRNVRKLERAIFQRNSNGQPFLMEPDPEVVALQGRVGGVDRRLADVEATLQRMNGDIERLTIDLENMKTENGRLRTRLGESEARLSTLETRAREEAELNAPIVANSPTGTAAGDLAAANRLLSTNPARGERALEVLIVTWPDAEEARSPTSGWATCGWRTRTPRAPFPISPPPCAAGRRRAGRRKRRSSSPRPWKPRIRAPTPASPCASSAHATAPARLRR
jgi:hypothetical protein